MNVRKMECGARVWVCVRTYICYSAPLLSLSSCVFDEVQSYTTFHRRILSTFSRNHQYQHIAQNIQVGIAVWPVTAPSWCEMIDSARRPYKVISSVRISRSSNEQEHALNSHLWSEFGRVYSMIVFRELMILAYRHVMEAGCGHIHTHTHTHNIHLQTIPTLRSASVLCV